MWFVDVERGKREGMALSKELNKTTMADPRGYGTMEHGQQDRDLEAERAGMGEGDVR